MEVEGVARGKLMERDRFWQWERSTFGNGKRVVGSVNSRESKTWNHAGTVEERKGKRIGLVVLVTVKIGRRGIVQ